MIDDLYEKYGSDADWETVDPYDLYNALSNSRDIFEALFEEGLMSSHPLYESVRRRCITDLFFLNLFLWDANPFGGPDEPISSNLMTMENHEQVISMFVKKNPDLSIAAQSDIKNILILYPRGTLKSSWGIFDIIQWILLDASIRILVLTAADDLAESIVNEIKGYFVIKERVPSLMNMFWPEHCALDKDLKGAGEFTTPAWTQRQIKRREPTVMSKSIESTISGFHFDVAHLDDAISDRNSNNEEACEKVKKRYGLTRKTLRTFGYTNLIGTRYADEDLYGTVLAQNDVGNFTVENFGLCSKKITNPDNKTKILIGAAMTIKPDCEKDLAEKNIPRHLWFRKASRDGVEVLMPKVLTYDHLLPEYERDPEAFETQMRQNVLPPTSQKFTREMLIAATVSWADLPPYGRITVCFDLNGGKGKKDNDNSVGSAVLWDDKGAGTVIDLLVQNFPTPIATAKGVVDFCRKHHPDILSIEDSLGMRMIEPTIWVEADNTTDDYVKQLVRRIYWRQVDTKKDAKKNRIDNLLPLIVYKRIKFVSHLPYKEKMYEQFIKPITTSSKNDIPDCISFQTDFLPSVLESEEVKKNREEEQKRFREEEKRRDQWKMLYEENTYDYYREPVFEILQEEIYEEPYSNTSGLGNVLGSGLIG